MSYRLPVSVAGTRALTSRAAHEAAVNQSLAHVAGLPVAGVRVVGEWAASSGAFPAASVTGYAYIVTDDGTVGGEEFFAGDRLLAMIDAPSTTVYAANWLRVPEPAGTEPIVFGADTVAGLAAVNLARFAGAATLGRGMAGDGGGAAYLRTVSAVRGGFEDQSEDTWGPVMYSPINPVTFGSKGDDPDFDDSTGIQNMLEAIMENGRGVGVFQMGKLFYPGDAERLIIDPRSVRLIGHGAALDFRNKTFSNPASEPERLTNPGFATDTAWIDLPTNAAGEAWTISSGVATFVPTSPDLYAGKYQAVTAMIPGRRYILRFTFDALLAGITQTYGVVAMRTEGPDAGATLGPLVTVAGTYSREFTWPASAGTTGWFQFKHQGGGATVSSVSLKILPQNECLLIDGGYASGIGSGTINQYGHTTQAVEGLRMIGGSDNARDYGDAIVGLTNVSAQSSRFTLRDNFINGFGRGVNLMDRSYLMNINQTDIVSCGIGLQFSGGPDSGENIKLFQSNFYNSTTGVVNNGGYMHMHMCSVDYVGQAFIEMNGGYTHAHQCHWEKTSPAVADNYPFRINNGTFILDGGYCQLNVVDPTVIDHVFSVGGSARVVVDKMQSFGLRTATDAIATGAGADRGNFRFTGIGPKSMSPFVTRTEPGSLVPYSSYTAGGEPLDTWRYCVNGGTRVNAKETSIVKAERLTTGERTSGRKGVKITKLGGAGDGSSFLLAVPCPPGGMVSQEFYIKILPNAGPASDAEGDVFIDWRQVQLVGSDQGLFALPADTGLNWWGGEFNVARDINWNAGQDWTRVLRNGSQNTNTNAQGQEFGANWRTHWVLILNLQDVPTSTEILVCDLMAEVL